MSITNVKVFFLKQGYFIEKINNNIYLSNNLFTTTIDCFSFTQMLKWCKTLYCTDALSHKLLTEQNEVCPYTRNNIYVIVTFYYKKLQCDLIYFNVESQMFQFVQLKNISKLLNFCSI